MIAVIAANLAKAEKLAKAMGPEYKAFSRDSSPCGYCFDEILLSDIHAGQTLKQAMPTHEWIVMLARQRLQPNGEVRYI